MCRDRNTRRNGYACKVYADAAGAYRRLRDFLVKYAQPPLSCAPRVKLIKGVDTRVASSKCTGVSQRVQITRSRSDSRNWVIRRAIARDKERRSLARSRCIAKSREMHQSRASEMQLFIACHKSRVPGARARELMCVLMNIDADS